MEHVQVAEGATLHFSCGRWCASGWNKQIAKDGMGLQLSDKTPLYNLALQRKYDQSVKVKSSCSLFTS